MGGTGKPTRAIDSLRFEHAKAAPGKKKKMRAITPRMRAEEKVCASVCVHGRVLTYADVCWRMLMYAAHACGREGMCVRMCACMCIYIHTHTHHCIYSIYIYTILLDMF